MTQRRTVIVAGCSTEDWPCVSAPAYETEDVDNGTMVTWLQDEDPLSGTTIEEMEAHWRELGATVEVVEEV